MLQATKDQDVMGEGLFCTCPKQYLWESTWIMYTGICHIGVGNMSISIKWPPWALLTAWQWLCMEAIKHCTSHCKSVGGGGVVDSNGAHTDPVHPIDVLLGLNLANGQAKVMSGHFGATETPNTCNMWSGIVMLEHSTIDIHVRSDMML